MQKFIPISFKTLLKKLHIAEHYFFYDSAIISVLLTLMNSLPQLSGMFNALKTVFDREDALYKLSQASMLTSKLRILNGKRCAYFTHIWGLIDILKYENLAANIQEAIEKLEFLHNTYKSLIYGNYTEISGMMINFLQDCEKPAYQPSIQLLGLTEVVDKIKTAETEFEALYNERSFSKEQIAEMGKLAEIRIEVDNAFSTLVDAINYTWTANEMGAGDPALRAKLIEVKEHIAAAIHQTELNLARRGHHKVKEDDKEDGGTQTPTTPPTPPPPGTQTPNTDRPDASQTTQNPTDEPHHLDPNEHPAMGERKADEQKKKEDEKKKDEEKK
ncbi:MAG: DUF6261 family protein [Tannerellaceae bacterium]|jgi:hypothetical protein|nr:DUF6261 family protein [Tannerellaceae bacterium]